MENQTERYFFVLQKSNDVTAGLKIRAKSNTNRMTTVPTAMANQSKLVSTSQMGKKIKFVDDDL
jgi:hypothetical protein